MERVDKTCTRCGATWVEEFDAADYEASPLARSFLRMRRTPLALCSRCIDGLEREQGERQDDGRLRTRRAASGLPRSLDGVTFDRLAVTGPAVDGARAWARGDLRGLVLAGEVGVGKTFLAGAAANERLTRGPLRWVSTPALLAKAVAADDVAKRAALDVLTGKYAALVLDDFDKVGSSEWATSQLYLAVDNAVVQELPLLVTTNLGAKELAARFGEAITSRLLGYCQAHRLEGDDRRQAA